MYFTLEEREECVCGHTAYAHWNDLDDAPSSYCGAGAMVPCDCVHFYPRDLAEINAQNAQLNLNMSNRGLRESQP